MPPKSISAGTESLVAKASAKEAFAQAIIKIARAKNGLSRKLGFGDLRTLEKLPPLAGLTSLQELSLSGTRIVDLSPLASCHSLRRLYLSRTLVQDLRPIAEIKTLKELYLHETQVSDLSPLINLSHLTILTLRGAPVVDASPIAALGKLTRLDLQDTRVLNFGFLSGLGNLEWLQIDRSRVQDLRAIAKLTNLRIVSMTGTNVSDLSPLVGLSHLAGLQIDDSKVSNLSPLANMISLQTAAQRRPFREYYYHGEGKNYGWASGPDSLGLSFKGCPVSDPVLLEFSLLRNPERTSATFSYLRRQQNLPPIEELRGRFKEAGIDKTRLQPLDNIPSPFAFRISAEGKVALDSNSADLPLFPLPTSEKDHANRLDVCRSLAEDLVSELRAGKFQAREQYELGLERYAARLPSGAQNGNVLLADAEARTLRSLFAAEADILSVGFAAKLKTFLEQHIGLRVFYPEIGNFYRDVQSGRIEEPLPLDAVQGFVRGVKESSPTIFDPDVQYAIEGSAIPTSTAARPPDSDLPPAEANQPLPPKDPLGDMDPNKAWDFTFAGAANNLWKAFREGEKVHNALEAWQKAGADLSPYINTILDWLHHFMNSGGGPPMPPAISI
jgi:hypothetical protein